MSTQNQFIHILIHGKSGFADVSKNLTRYSLKIILLDHQNNYVERLNIFDNAAKCFNILATSLKILYGKNDFVEKSKILLDHQNTFVGILKMMRRYCKKF